MSNSLDMGRLISLRLQPSPTPKNTKRRISLQSPSPPPSKPLPSIPVKPINRARPVPGINLTVLPYTELEWRETMDEVKMLYLKRQYKQCSARCIHILNSIKDTCGVHSLHQIYISFFAASSLEETSRSLHSNTSAKLPLLQQSLTYYQHAESHMEYASFSADPTVVKAVRETGRESISSGSSHSSSVRSSIDSIFSHTSSLASTVSSVPSPPPSVYSSTPEPPKTHKRSASAPLTNPGVSLAPAPLKIKKKVSFSLQLPRILPEADSRMADDSTLLSYFPSPPSASPSSSPPPTSSSLSDYLLSRALDNYYSHLSDLHSHLNQHIRSVEHQIEALRKSRKAWRSNSPTAFTDFGKDIQGVEEEDRRKIEMTARIQRLKEKGWRRERFDGKRYAVLCEQALEDMDL
ncbi:hypothetical protein D0Z07_2396 [Hyphodiscus hymeniophilus]|uniref:Uncharacterized protein n=1 Tax=Hyphodiscus hymeniophilus TaxID=353542 RepID=A0A9P7AZ50_9HELO|nr:hypothetical protein D0Z07_2396 [Hyphodiscus hymeniophilus]